MKALLDLKDAELARKGIAPSASFSREEEEAIRRGFKWLLNGIPAKAKDGRQASIDATVNAFFKRCKKPSRREIDALLESKGWNEAKATLLYKTASLYLNFTHPSNSRRMGKNTGREIAALRTNEGIRLQGINGNIHDYISTAIHELGHDLYGLNERACYALEGFYRVSKGGWGIERLGQAIEKDNEKVQGRKQGYQDALRAVQAMRAKRSEHAAWVLLGQIAKNPENRLR